MEWIDPCQIEARFPNLLIGVTDHDWYYRTPDSETFTNLRRRAGAWLAEQSGPVIAVAHGLIGRAIRAVYLGLSDEAAVPLTELQDTVLVLRKGTVDRFPTQ